MKNHLRHLLSIDFSIVIIVGILCIINLSLIYAITVPDGNSKVFFTQAFAYSLGFILCVLIVGFVNIESISSSHYIFLGLALLVQASCYTPLGFEANGARSWIDLGFMTAQPSELTKVLFIIALVSFLKKYSYLLDTFLGFLKVCLFAMPMIGIVLIEDLGSGLIMFLTFVVTIFIFGINRWLFIKLSIGAIILIPLIYNFLADYQQKRLLSFLFPDNLSIETNYQLYQSKLTIASGGLLGKGLSNGEMTQLNFLPVKESDFIFAVLCERLGIITGIFLIIIFVVLLYRCIKIATKANDVFCSNVCFAISVMFIIQMVENIGMTIGLMPVTGITLPFMSAGGSSILCNMICIGIILNISTKRNTFEIIS